MLPLEARFVFLVYLFLLFASFLVELSFLFRFVPVVLYVFVFHVAFHSDVCLQLLLGLCSFPCLLLSRSDALMLSPVFQSLCVRWILFFASLLSALSALLLVLFVYCFSAFSLYTLLVALLFINRHRLVRRKGVRLVINRHGLMRERVGLTNASRRHGGVKACGQLPLPSKGEGLGDVIAIDA